MIEVVETYTAGRYRGDVIGGNQPVTIVERPAQTIREYYVPGAGTDYRAGGARWKTFHVPAGWVIEHANGRTSRDRLDDAIRVAVYHAKRGSPR